MARIIKKGKCEYRPLAVPPGPEPEDESDENGSEGTFNSLSVVIETDSRGNDSGAAPDDAGEPCDEGPADPLLEARRQAEQIVQEARRQAEQIRSEAEEELRNAQRQGEEIESLAYSIGYDQGKKDGEEIGRKQYQAVAMRLEKLLESINEGAEALLPQYESQMVEVAMEAARQIIDREIELSPEIVLDSIRAAMGLIVEGSAVHLHLNPADIDALEEKIREQFVMAGRHGLDIVNDPRVERGGCLIETEYGLIDATVRAKWQAVSDTIKRIMAERTGAVSSSKSSGEKDLTGERGGSEAGGGSG